MRSCSLTFATLAFLAPSYLQAELAPIKIEKSITIATGTPEGLYYLLAGTICNFVNLETSTNNIRCNVESTDGSASNVERLRDGSTTFALVQADVAEHAKNPDLRALFSTYTEALTLIASKRSKIAHLSDIRGKRINIGSPGSGQEFTTTELFDACKLNRASLSLAGTMKVSELPQAMQDGKIDAYFYVVGHPAVTIQNLAASLPTSMVPIEGSCVDKLIESHRSYTKTSVRTGLYKGTDKEVPTLGVRALLLGTRSVPDDIVRTVMTAVIQHLDAIRLANPAFESISRDTLRKNLTVPLHPEAERVLKQSSIL